MYLYLVMTSFTSSNNLSKEPGVTSVKFDTIPPLLSLPFFFYLFLYLL